MRKACGQACCWCGAAAVASVRVCTKVMALQPGSREGRTVSLLGINALSLYILLGVLHKTGVLLIRIAAPPPRTSGDARSGTWAA